MVDITKQKLNIGIVGGSLAGLVYGVVLKRHGHDVKILERNISSAMHGLGAGLTAARDMQEFMQVYDLTNLPYYIDATTTRLISSKGELLRQSPVPQALTSWDAIYYRLRTNFDGFRSGYCEPPPAYPGDGKVSYMDGCTVTNLEREDSLVKAQYQNAKGKPESVSFDLLIAADGSNSKIRRLLLPDIQREYLYTAWRGTAPEDQISQESRASLKVDPMSCVIDNSITVSYLIPGTNGELEPGKRVYNWVWYCKYLEASDELRDIMTDVDGKEHHFSVPIGMIRPERVDRQKTLARELLAPCVAELIRKTKEPFIQAITDVISPKAVLSNGRVLLVGDAFATLRPLAGLGLNQAAKGAMSLVEVLEGRLILDEWEQNALAFAKQARDKGIRREVIFELGSIKTAPVTGVTKKNNKL